VIYILIPAHNNKKEVLALLGCLSRQSYKDIKIVLVDDGSTDNTAQEIEELFPDTVVLRGDGSLWWTGANVMGVNFILKEAKDGDFILLLNNDLVVEDDYVKTLVDASVANGGAIAGSTMVDYTNHDFVESGVELDNYLNLTVNHDNDKINSMDFDLKTDVLPGRGTLIPIEVFKKIGNFNLRKLPHYGADYEFTIRARRAGFRLLVSHKARVYARLDITGLAVPDKRIISLKECYQLLFFKKSTSNIFYYLNYVWLCSEPDYKLKNAFSAARGILGATLGKTIPFITVYFVLSFIKRSLFFIFKFLFKGSPLRASDIENYGLNFSEFLLWNILEEVNFKDKKYYFIRESPVIRQLSEEKRNKLVELKQLSCRYSHKVEILSEKVVLLIGRGK
jgi:GT2 family glycosyltransferase